jgi:hypothetical protein
MWLLLTVQMLVLFVGGLVGLVVGLVGEFFGGGFISEVVGGLVGDSLVVLLLETWW